jgi:hypothetical protein
MIATEVYMIATEVDDLDELPNFCYTLKDSLSKRSFTNIAAAPIPLPIHILVHRISAFLRFNSASPVTTCLTPAIITTTMSTEIFQKI